MDDIQQTYINEFNKGNYDFFKLIENPTDEMIFTYSIKVDNNYFSKIKNPTDDMNFKYAIRWNYIYFSKIENQTNEMCLKILEYSIYNIQHIKNPTFDQWMYIYNKLKKENGILFMKPYLELNKNHDYLFCKMLVSVDYRYIKYINNDMKTKELCDIVFKGIKDPTYLHLIPSQFMTTEMYESLLNKSAGNIKYIPKELRTFEMYKNLISKNPDNIVYIYDVLNVNDRYDFYILEKLIEVDNKIILYIKHHLTVEQYIELSKIAMRKEKQIRTDINDTDIWNYILSKDGLMLNNCPNKTKENCKIAYNQNKASKQFIPFIYSFFSSEFN